MQAPAESRFRTDGAFLASVVFGPDRLKFSTSTQDDEKFYVFGIGELRDSAFDVPSVVKVAPELRMAMDGFAASKRDDTRLPGEGRFC